jgi:aminoglycoside phosphotransferase (APT) family kinase protein
MKVSYNVTVESLLERINERHGAGFRFRGRCEGGENEGAYSVVDAAGAPFVLKWHRRPDRLGGLERARRITDHLRSRGAPVPSYHLMGALPDGMAYWLQTALHGAPAHDLNPNHVQPLLAINDLQAGEALSAEQDWSAYVRAVVFAGESGWADSLKQHSVDTRAILARLRRLVAGQETYPLRTDDIAHGDMGLGNVLVEGDGVTGIIDWDAAGCGDRALDLSKLLYSAYRNEPVRRQLQEQIAALSGREALDIYLAYNILAQLDWSIHHHSRAAVMQGVALAQTILADRERR